MESLWGFENQHLPVPSGIIIKGFLAWYFWVFVMHGMNIRSPAKIPESDDLELPYFLLGDEIFPLSNWLMRPYSGKALTSETRKIFNY